MSSFAAFCFLCASVTGYVDSGMDNDKIPDGRLLHRCNCLPACLRKTNRQKKKFLALIRRTSPSIPLLVGVPSGKARPMYHRSPTQAENSRRICSIVNPFVYTESLSDASFDKLRHVDSSRLTNCCSS